MPLKISKTNLLLATLLALPLTLAADPPPGKGYNKNSKPSSEQENTLEGLVEGAILVGAGISTADAKRIARDIGLSGYKPLPPGIRKNLSRGKPLPPGIAKSRLPKDYIARLPNYPGYEWESAGTDLILISIATQVVSDILRDVFD